jgi:uncharacterized protein YhhL (DUF1145 family)
VNNTLLKGGSLAFYLLALASPLISALQPYSRTLLIIVGIFALAHLAEYLIVRKRLATIPANGMSHFVSVLLFGFIHWAPLLKSSQD